jgi:hypothetical protein
MNKLLYIDNSGSFQTTNVTYYSNLYSTSDFRLTIPTLSTNYFDIPIFGGNSAGLLVTGIWVEGTTTASRWSSGGLFFMNSTNKKMFLKKINYFNDWGFGYYNCQKNIPLNSDLTGTFSAAKLKNIGNISDDSVLTIKNGGTGLNVLSQSSILYFVSSSLTQSVESVLPYNDYYVISNNGTPDFIQEQPEISYSETYNPLVYYYTCSGGQQNTLYNMEKPYGYTRMKIILMSGGGGGASGYYGVNGTTSYNKSASGGGCGQLLVRDVDVIKDSFQCTISVGAGGLGGTRNSSTNSTTNTGVDGSAGQNTYINSQYFNITSYGGGGGRFSGITASYSASDFPKNNPYILSGGFGGTVARTGSSGRGLADGRIRKNSSFVLGGNGGNITLSDRGNPGADGGFVTVPIGFFPHYIKIGTGGGGGAGSPANVNGYGGYGGNAVYGGGGGGGGADVASSGRARNLSSLLSKGGSGGDGYAIVVLYE